MATFTFKPRLYLSEGNRYVEEIGIGEYVIKWGCPFSSRTGGQNRQEARAWESVKHLPNVADYIVPVMAYDPSGAWLMMPSVHHVSSSDIWTKDFELTREASRLEDWLMTNGLRDAALDMHQGNVGRLDNGRLVMLDYGFMGYENGRDAFAHDDFRAMCRIAAPRDAEPCFFCTQRDGE